MVVQTNVTVDLPDVVIRLGGLHLFTLPRDTSLVNLVHIIRDSMAKTVAYTRTVHMGPSEQESIRLSPRYRKMMRSVIGFFALTRVPVSQDMLNMCVELGITRSREARFGKNLPTVGRIVRVVQQDKTAMTGVLFTSPSDPIASKYVCWFHFKCDLGVTIENLYNV